MKMQDQNFHTTAKVLNFKMAIKPFSLTFLDAFFEDEFYKYKSMNYKLIRTILFLSFICYFTILLKPLQIYLIFIMDLNYLSVFQDAESYLNSAIRYFAFLVIEIIIHFIPKLKIIRGFVLCIGSAINVYYVSYNMNISLKTNNFHCVFVTIPIFLNVAFISLIYCYNWVLGGLNFMLVCFVPIIFVIISPILLFDKITFFITIICLGIIGELLIRYIEYILRQSFYYMRQATQEKNNTNKILQKLPEPLVIVEKDQIIYGNEAFQNIKSEIDFNASHNETENKIVTSLNENQTESINSLKSIAENIYNKEKQKSLQDYLNSSESIPNSTLFDFIDETNKIEKTFEIISNEIQIQSQIKKVFVLKNMTYYKKFKKGKSKAKYSRLFIASVTHNFRTPLNMILGNSDLLKGKVNELELLEFLNNIIKGSKMLNLLIEDLIDYSRLLTGAFEPKIKLFNLIDSINQLKDLFMGRFIDKNLAFECIIDSEVPQMINSDERRIMQIITHLLENALKFTIHGTVKVQVISFNEGSQINISVEDTGIGIKSEEIPKLFESYGKLADTNNINPNGIGMGLYICKKIAKKILGSLNVESVFGVGSKFTYEFTNQSTHLSDFSKDREELKSTPQINEDSINKNQLNNLNDKEEEKGIRFDNSNAKIVLSERTERRQIMECSCPKVLIVDDEHTNRYVLSQMCLRIQLRYEEAKNGQEALNCVQNFINKYNCCKTYKMILMDSNMPVMNGEKSTLAIRSFLKTQSFICPKIYCVTANSDVEQLVKEYQKYIYDKIISKPISFEIFKQEIGYIW